MSSLQKRKRETDRLVQHVLSRKRRCQDYDADDEDNTWIWYMEQDKAFPLPLVLRKDIFLYCKVQHIMKRIRACLAKRFNRGIDVWEGDHSLPEPCLQLDDYTPDQGRNKRIITAPTIDVYNNWLMNIGVAVLISEDRLTDEQKNGLISMNGPGGWVVSRICGNWNCATASHITVEPRKDNTARKTCFERGSCRHSPHRPRCRPGMKVGNQNNGVDDVLARILPNTANAIRGKMPAPKIRQRQIEELPRRGLLTEVAHNEEMFLNCFLDVGNADDADDD